MGQNEQLELKRILIIEIYYREKCNFSNSNL